MLSLRKRMPNLPKYISEANGRIVWRPYVAPGDRTHIDTDKNGFLKPPIRLGPSDATYDEILAAYVAAKASLDAQTGAKKHSLRWVVSKYQASKAFKDLAIGSQIRAETLGRILDQPVRLHSQDTTLGDLNIRLLTRPIVRRLAERRLTDYQSKGRKGTVMVNREITFCSSAVGWAQDNIDNLGIIENPFRIKKFKEVPNKRYVTDQEYEIQKNFAAKYGEEYLPIVFEITYLVASRGIETLDIKLSDIDPDRETGGIYINRRKGSKSNVIEWSDRLFAAYQVAMRSHKKHKISAINAPLIVGSHGKQLKKSSLDTAMQRLKKLMASEEHDLGHVYWSLHKLKSKGISDASDDRIAGHKSESMRNRYKTNLERHKPAK